MSSYILWLKTYKKFPVINFLKANDTFYTWSGIQSPEPNEIGLAPQHCKKGLQEAKINR